MIEVSRGGMVQGQMIYDVLWIWTHDTPGSSLKQTDEKNYDGKLSKGCAIGL